MIMCLQGQNFRRAWQFWTALHGPTAVTYKRRLRQDVMKGKPLYCRTLQSDLASSRWNFVAAADCDERPSENVLFNRLYLPAFLLSFIFMNAGNAAFLKYASIPFKICASTLRSCTKFGAVEKVKVF